MNFGVKQPLKVKEVFKKTNDEDGFFVKLEDGNELPISLTHWNSTDYKTINNQDIIFSTKKGYDISFSKDQANIADNF
jgi:hypothetical protein